VAGNDLGTDEGGNAVGDRFDFVWNVKCNGGHAVTLFFWKGPVLNLRGQAGTRMDKSIHPDSSLIAQACYTGDTVNTGSKR